MDKPTIMRRVSEIIQRLRAIRATAYMLGQETGIIEKELDVMEEELAKQIDDYMASRLQRHFCPTDKRRRGYEEVRDRVNARGGYADDLHGNDKRARCKRNNPVSSSGEGEVSSTEAHPDSARRDSQ